MKPKITCNLLLLAGLTVISCRESEDVAYAESAELVNERPSVLSNGIYDSRNDSVISFYVQPKNLPKDPPISGNHWKMKK